MLAHTTGTNTVPVSRPSHQFSLISNPITAMNVIVLVIRKTVPKPANRRIAARSLVARDSNCPDCQASWNAGGSRCRCA